MYTPEHPQNLILHLPSQGCGEQTKAGNLLREGLVWESVGQVLKRQGGLDRYRISQYVWLGRNLFFSYSRGQKPEIKVPEGLVSSEPLFLGYKWSSFPGVFTEPIICVSICVSLSVSTFPS